MGRKVIVLSRTCLVLRYLLGRLAGDGTKGKCVPALILAEFMNFARLRLGYAQARNVCAVLLFVSNSEASHFILGGWGGPFSWAPP